ncbi:pyrimidine/purine nucleoside phosphorylase [Candidatus Formimonas warabiya]|nr:pyrimidine/purine nucleoside phosphorylase [Candidatus Formimonas warabiya]
MMEFKNARIVKKANVYFDGKVTSRTIYTESGERKTLGIMLPGDYEFGTGAEELMEILGGEMDVCLPGETTFKTYREGDSFIVPANSKFKLILKTVADYCCSYKE